MMRVNFPLLCAALGALASSCTNRLLECALGLQAVSVTPDRRDGKLLALVRGDRQQIGTTPHEQDGFVSDMTNQRLAICKPVQRDALAEVRAMRL
jgi:hypothetical protein